MAELLFAHCRKCKYELTGLSRVGRCPECGQRYNLDTGSGTLEMADPLAEQRRRLQKIKAILLFWVAAICTLVSGGLILAGIRTLGGIGLVVALVIFMSAISSYLDHRQLAEAKLEEDEPRPPAPNQRKRSGAPEAGEHEDHTKP